MTKQTNTATKTESKSDSKVRKVSAAVDKLPTVSAKIRALNAQGWTRSEIAKGLGKRYQHVRNVLITPLVGKPAKA